MGRTAFHPGYGGITETGCSQNHAGCYAIELRAQKTRIPLLTKSTEIGDVQKGFAEADKIIEYTFTRAPNTVAGVEGMACVAQWRGDFLDIWPHHASHAEPMLSNPSLYSVGLSFVSLGYGTIDADVKNPAKE